MVAADSAELLATPSKGFARIIFMRPSNHGPSIDSAVFQVDGDKQEMLGAVAAGKKIAVQVTPGQHRFMVVNQNVRNADFMDANVEGGKTYYVLVSPRGYPGIFFGLVPLKNSPADSKFSRNGESFSRWNADTDLMKMTAQGDTWAQENAALIRSMRNSSYAEWVKNPESTTPPKVLAPVDGM